ncbi:hypothetical protein [Bacillus sp. CDB3]|uniref:hypothetical protein n=1 Tax=Bacillus sp. CDB3 TaxID=360310 RepID=UPI0009D91236|nr:hypothetical protein [Bacillus sp. CDB3]OQR53408.1 hypothetical protein CDB3_29940 [Bacillus sp. CDB3]
MSEGTNIFIFALIFGVHYFLSRRTSVYSGAIIPVAYLVYCGWIFITHQTDHLITTVLLMLLGLALFILEWENGREAFKKNRKNELQRMKIHDI